MKKWQIAGLVAVIVLITGIVIAEQMTFSTYYPAPYGVYNEMRARRMAVGGNYLDSVANSVADDNLIVEGNVGIGTTNPSEKLVIGNLNESSEVCLVLKTAAQVSSAIKFREFTDDYGFDIQYDAGSDEITDRLNFIRYNNSSEGDIAMSIHRQSGNIGIGTTDPKAKLDVVGHINGTPVGGHWKPIRSAGVGNYQWGEELLNIDPTYMERSSVSESNDAIKILKPGFYYIDFDLLSYAHVANDSVLYVVYVDGVEWLRASSISQASSVSGQQYATGHISGIRYFNANEKIYVKLEPAQGAGNRHESYGGLTIFKLN